jgi:hypothetical protein
MDEKWQFIAFHIKNFNIKNAEHPDLQARQRLHQCTKQPSRVVLTQRLLLQDSGSEFLSKSFLLAMHNKNAAN